MRLIADYWWLWLILLLLPGIFLVASYYLGGNPIRKPDKNIFEIILAAVVISVSNIFAILFFLSLILNLFIL